VLMSLATSALPRGGPFFCTEIDCVVADTDGGRSVAVTMVPAAVHEALGVVARGTLRS